MESHNICDYSLLLGLHFKDKNMENTNNQSGSLLTSAVRDAENEQCLDEFISENLLKNTSATPINNEKSLFKLYKGGILSNLKNEVYFVGIIDILTEYNYKKMGEHIAKSFFQSNVISAVPPPIYRKRYQKYVNSIIV